MSKLERRRPIDERQAELDKHYAGECGGFPLCRFCIEDWEEQNREELDSQGYYLGDKWTR